MWHLVEDVHHGFGGKVLQVLSVLAEALKELHASQHNQWLLQKHNTELRDHNTAAAHAHNANKCRQNKLLSQKIQQQ